MKFKRNKDGLYTFKPPKRFKKEVAARKEQQASHVVTTVMENKVRFSKRQVNNAKKARKLYHAICNGMSRGTELQAYAMTEHHYELSSHKQRCGQRREYIWT